MRFAGRAGEWIIPCLRSAGIRRKAGVYSYIQFMGEMICEKIRVKKSFDLAEESSISSCVDFVQEKLKAAGLDRLLMARMMLLTEECATMLRKNSPGEGKLLMDVQKFNSK